MLSVDEFSGYLIGKELTSLTKPDVLKAFDDLMQFYEIRAQSPIGTLVTDRERSFQALNQGHKLPLKLVASGRHARVAERQIRHVKNMMRAVIYKLPYKLPGSLYGRLLFHCANLTNYTVRANYFNVPSTPSELVVGKLLDFNNVVEQPFGKLCMAYDPRHGKDDMKSYEALVVGFEDENHGNVYVWAINSEREITSTTYKPKDIHMTDEIISKINDREKFPNNIPLLEDLDGAKFEANQEDDEEQKVESLVNLATSNELGKEEYRARFDQILENTESSYCEYAKSAVESLGTSVTDDGNLTLAQALVTLDRSIVMESLKGELDNLKKHKVVQFVIDKKEKEKVLKEHKPLPSKIFLKGKYDAIGKFIKLKSRVVAGGHRQRPGSYGRTASPTVDILHVMMVLSLLRKLRAKIATIDVAAAFLHAELDEIIYIILPKDVVRFLNEHDEEFRREISGGEETVLALLKKALYGIKQASHNWNELITAYLVSQHFKVAQGIDSCVFVKGNKESGNLFIALLHVDDLLLVAQNGQDIIELKHNMTMKFGEITYHDKDLNFLGMNLVVEKDGTVVLNQPGYARRICDQEGGDKVSTTPATATLFAEVDDMKKENGLDSTEYKSLLMSLMFLATRTRPDILKECTFLASFAVNPGIKAFEKLRRVYSYVRGTINKGIKLSASSYQLRLTTDAAYALHVNGRSHTGVMITFDGEQTSPIYSKSHMQKIVTLSSTESELVALVDGMKRLIPLKGLLDFFGLKNESTPSIVQCDNKSVLHMIANGAGFSGKSRHMRVRWHFVHEMLDEGLIRIVHVPGDDNPTDLLTKPMGGKRFRRLRSMILNEPENDNSDSD